MTRLVIELAPGITRTATPTVEAAWNTYQRHCLSRPKDDAWEAKRAQLHRELMEAFPQ